MTPLGWLGRKTSNQPTNRFQYGRIVPLVILFQDSVQAIMMHEKNMAPGEQGYKIDTKILEQWTWLKLQQ